MNSDWMMPDEIFSWLEENLEPGAKILEFEVATEAFGFRSNLNSFQSSTIQIGWAFLRQRTFMPRSKKTPCLPSTIKGAGTIHKQLSM